MQSTTRVTFWTSTALMGALVALGALVAAGCDKQPADGDEPEPSARSQPGSEAPGANETPGNEQAKGPESQQPGERGENPTAERGSESPGMQEGKPGAPKEAPLKPSGDKPGGDEAEVTDAELKKVMKVTERLESKRSDLKAGLEGAESKEEMMKAKQDLKKETEAAVEKAGLEWDRFREISKRVNQDPELQARLRALDQD